MNQWFGNFEFLQSQWLWLLPVLFLITLLLTQILRTRTRSVTSQKAEPASLLLVSTATDLRFAHPLIGLLSNIDNKQQTHSIRYILFALIIACLILALAEPVLRGEKLPDPPRERDIVFIVDTSVSMILRDYVLEDQRIERMSLLKGLLVQFVQKLKGERMGVIVFGDHAYTLVPLTADQNLLNSMLRRIKTTMAGRYNAIGEAITLAVKQTDEQPERKRVLILLTAASQPTGKISPMTAAEYARQAGLPLYTIAIGATDYTAEDIRESGLIYRPVNTELLQSLATHTGAQSYLASDTQSLEHAIKVIEQKEANLAQVPVTYYYQALYYWPLLLGLLIICIMQLTQLMRVRV